MNRIQSLRNRAVIQQNNLCYYCGWPMWNGDAGSLPAYFAAYRMKSPQAKKLECTAEHLLARRDGGKDSAENIVAACHTCNKRRHPEHAKKTADEYKAMIVAKVEAGKWHAQSYRKVIGVRFEPVPATPAKSPAATSRSAPRDRSDSAASAPAPA